MSSLTDRCLPSISHGRMYVHAIEREITEWSVCSNNALFTYTYTLIYIILISLPSRWTYVWLIHVNETRIKNMSLFSSTVRDSFQDNCQDFWAGPHWQQCFSAGRGHVEEQKECERLKLPILLAPSLFFLLIFRSLHACGARLESRYDFPNIARAQSVEDKMGCETD